MEEWGGGGRGEGEEGAWEEEELFEEVGREGGGEGGEVVNVGLLLSGRVEEGGGDGEGREFLY